MAAVSMSVSMRGRVASGRLCESGASGPVAKRILLFGGGQRIPWSRNWRPATGVAGSCRVKIESENGPRNAKKRIDKTAVSSLYKML